MRRPSAMPSHHLRWAGSSMHDRDAVVAASALRSRPARAPTSQRPPAGRPLGYRVGCAGGCNKRNVVVSGRSSPVTMLLQPRERIRQPDKPEPADARWGWHVRGGGESAGKPRGGRGGASRWAAGHLGRRVRCLGSRRQTSGPTQRPAELVSVSDCIASPEGSGVLSCLLSMSVGSSTFVKAGRLRRRAGTASRLPRKRPPQ